MWIRWVVALSSLAFVVLVAVLKTDNEVYTHSPVAVANELSASDKSFASAKCVILYLYGKRHEKYFLGHALPSLEEYFLRLYPRKYPVRVFIESLGIGTKLRIKSTLVSASDVIFEDVSRFWRLLPTNVSSADVARWVEAEPRARGHGRGYRVMCRFWAGLVWQLESMQQYDYYWRLDTDSVLLGPVKVDPFHQMHSRGCAYGFNVVFDDPEFVTRKLWPTFMSWAENQIQNPEVRHRVYNLCTNGTGQYTGTAYYNNFELGTMRLKTSETYLSLFRFLDENPPYGIFRYRWGDAPIHTLGVYSALGGNITSLCSFDNKNVPYAHAHLTPGRVKTQNWLALGLDAGILF